MRSTRSASTSTTTIFDVLKADHVEVLGLLDAAESAKGQNRRGLIEKIIDELTAHATAEEVVLYDNIAEADVAHTMTVEAKEEHLSAARLMSDLLDPGFADDVITAKIVVLREQLEHHIEEEEGELFTTARALLDDNVAEALAGEFLARKEELMTMPLAVRVQEAIARHQVMGKSLPSKAVELVARALNALDPR